MPEAIQLVRPGYVVRRGKSAGVVIEAGHEQLTVLPIVCAGAGPRYRADVAIDALGDMAALGVAGRDLVIRVSQPVRPQLAGQTVIGMVTADMARRIRVALNREITALGAEDHWDGARA